MLTLSFLREFPEEVIERLKIRNIDASEMVNTILNLDAERRRLQKELEEYLSNANALSKEIGNLYKEGKRDEAEQKKLLTQELKEKSDNLEKELQEAETSLNAVLVQLPNLPNKNVKAGRTPQDNEIVYSQGEALPAKEGFLPHWELAKKYDIIDFELGNKVTGAGFPFYKGKGARLQRALINFFLDEAHKQGYTEYEPPILVNEDTAYATGQLPDKEGQMYFCERDNFYLIPTAEVPLTNIYRDVIIKSSDFPVKLTAYTPCFRREAGSYGKDVRGLNRLHQFDKVEIVRLEHPERSYKALEEMRDYVAGLIQKLGLTYRILRLCGGDMGFTSAMTYDMEVYSEAQEKWLEVSSVSNFETFQANRLKLRFKEDSQSKTQLAHTLNGSALALPRIVAAILEKYQTERGIRVPEVLQGYTGFEWIE